MAAVLLCLATPLDLRAQAATPPDTSRVALLTRADRLGWALRLTSVSGHQTAGRVIAVTDTAVGLTGGYLGMADLLRIEREVADPALIKRGAVVGGLASLVLSSLIVAAYCEGDCPDSNSLATIAAVSVLGAGAGAVFGSIINDRRTWRVVWQLPL